MFNFPLWLDTVDGFLHNLHKCIAGKQNTRLYIGNLLHHVKATGGVRLTELPWNNVINFISDIIPCLTEIIFGVKSILNIITKVIISNRNIG